MASRPDFTADTDRPLGSDELAADRPDDKAFPDDGMIDDADDVAENEEDAVTRSETLLPPD